MKVTLALGILVIMLTITIGSISAQYPTVVPIADSNGPTPHGPTKTLGNNYLFIVNAPFGTFQSVQVVIGGIAYDMTYDNAAWRVEVPVLRGQTYFYRITTSSGVTFEGSIHKV